jgi:hypothetical protein
MGRNNSIKNVSFHPSVDHFPSTHAAEHAAEHATDRFDSESRDGDTAEGVKRPQRRMFLSLLLGFVSLCFLYYYLRDQGFLDRLFSRTQKPEQARAMLMPAADSGGEEAAYGEEELLALAKRLKTSGFKIYGVSQCSWTRKQRNLFGTGEARKVFESMYTECRTRDACPSHIRGFPTWALGDQSFPGFQPFEALQSMARDAEVAQPVRMLQQEAEPVDENKLEKKMPPTAVELREQEAVVSSPPPTSLPAAKQESGDDEKLLALLRKLIKEEMANQSGAEKMVENVRGQTIARPLAVPDMPGTAPWNVGPSLAVDQAMQGNPPRSAFQDSRPTASINQQILAGFDFINRENFRDPKAADFASARLPQATTITTGDAMKDKRVMQL